MHTTYPLVLAYTWRQLLAHRQRCDSFQEN